MFVNVVFLEKWAFMSPESNMWSQSAFSIMSDRAQNSQHFLFVDRIGNDIEQLTDFFLED